MAIWAWGREEGVPATWRLALIWPRWKREGGWKGPQEHQLPPVLSILQGSCHQNQMCAQKPGGQTDPHLQAGFFISAGGQGHGS